MRPFLLSRQTLPGGSNPQPLKRGDRFTALLPSLTFTTSIIYTLMCYRMTLMNLFFSNIFLATDLCVMLFIWQVYVQWFLLS